MATVFLLAVPPILFIFSNLIDRVQNVAPWWHQPLRISITSVLRCLFFHFHRNHIHRFRWYWRDDCAQSQTNDQELRSALNGGPVVDLWISFACVVFAPLASRWPMRPAAKRSGWIKGHASACIAHDIHVLNTLQVPAGKPQQPTAGCSGDPAPLRRVGGSVSRQLIDGLLSRHRHVRSPSCFLFLPSSP